MIDVKDFFVADTLSINEDTLVKEVEKNKPNLYILSMCYSQVSLLKTILEKNGLLAKQRLERYLMTATNGNIVELQPDQKNIIDKVVRKDNISKNVVLSGPEGSGKTMIAKELIKVMVYNYVHTKNLTPQASKEKIRVIFAACFEPGKDGQHPADGSRLTSKALDRYELYIFGILG